MAERMPPTSPRPDWRSLSKNLALWLLVALVAMALFQLMNNQKSAVQEFTYTAFKQQLTAGNVHDVPESASSTRTPAAASRSRCGEGERPCAYGKLAP